MVSGGERELNALLDDVFERSAVEIGAHVAPGVVAVVVPHAAPQYSGRVAATAYRLLQAARPERIILLGFRHCGAGWGVAIPSIEAYSTPLGAVTIDGSAAEDLCSTPLFRRADEVETCDHSVEIQLPFLQRACPAAKLIPLLVGDLDDQERMEAAEAIARVFRPGDVLIASSDLTHYGREFHYTPFPADRNAAGRLREIDRYLIDSASGIEDRLFLGAMGQSSVTPCGTGPIALLLRTLAVIYTDDVFQQELDYQTSGEITDDYTTSVSYAALGYFRRRSFQLSETEQIDVLRLARQTIEGAEFVLSPDVWGELRGKRIGVFVSLRESGRLIGCLGRLAPDTALLQAIPELATAACHHSLDRPAIRRPERLDVEISILTPMKLVRGAEAIRIGLDGAHLQMEGRRAVFLPQALHRDWSAETVLEMLFRKAGATRDERLRAKPRLFTFQAQVFRSDPFAATALDGPAA